MKLKMYQPYLAGAHIPSSAPELFPKVWGVILQERYISREHTWTTKGRNLWCTSRRRLSSIYLPPLLERGQGNILTWNSRDNSRKARYSTASSSSLKCRMARFHQDFPVSIRKGHHLLNGPHIYILENQTSCQGICTITRGKIRLVTEMHLRKSRSTWANLTATIAPHPHRRWTASTDQFRWGERTKPSASLWSS